VGRVEEKLLKGRGRENGDWRGEGRAVMGKSGKIIFKDG
jgi:hypothetical protein